MLYSLFVPFIDAVAGLFAGVLLFRFWMQVVRVRPPQPVAEFVFHLTDWLVKPLRFVIPGVAGLDWASLVGCFIVSLIYTAAKLWMDDSYFSVMLLVLALIRMAQWAIDGLTVILVIDVIFSWINPNAPLAPFVRALNLPLLKPIRRVVPPLGGLDLSPMVVFILLQIAGRALLVVFGAFV